MAWVAAMLGGACFGVPPADDTGDGPTSAAVTETMGPTDATTATSDATDSGDTDTTGLDGTVGATATDSEDSSSDTGAPLDPDLVAWYRFDDETDPLADGSGNTLHGFCSPDRCPTSVAGVVGSAAHFDGVDDGVRVAVQSALQTSAGFTVALWLRSEAFDLTSLRSAVSKAYGDGSLNTYEIYLHDWEENDTVELYVGIAAASTEDRIGIEPTFSPGEWAHVAGTWDGITAAMYVNGVLVGQLANIGAPFDSHDLILGADENSGSLGSTWNGDVDELRIYRRPLDPIEISALAQPE